MYTYIDIHIGSGHSMSTHGSNSASLYCDVKANPPATCIWSLKRSGVSLPCGEDCHNYLNNTNCKITFDPITCEVTQVDFYCNATNEVGSKLSSVPRLEDDGKANIVKR